MKGRAWRRTRRQQPPLAASIHVATDPSTVVVRYVLLMFTIRAVAPIAQHVEPAMRSVLRHRGAGRLEGRGVF
jgi:hypothetical protein